MKTSDYLVSPNAYFLANCANINFFLVGWLHVACVLMSVCIWDDIARDFRRFLRTYVSECVRSIKMY